MSERYSSEVLPHTVLTKASRKPLPNVEPQTNGGYGSSAAAIKTAGLVEGTEIAAKDPSSGA